MRVSASGIVSLSHTHTTETLLFGNITKEVSLFFFLIIIKYSSYIHVVLEDVALVRLSDS